MFSGRLASSVSIDAERRNLRTPLEQRALFWLHALERPALRRGVMVLAVTLCVPSVFTGLALDDYLLLLHLSEPSTSSTAPWYGAAPFDLFRWLDSQQVGALIDGLGMPWWTFQGAQCAFFRPLSSLTHAFDYALDPTAAGWMHVHNLLWFALLVWLAAQAYLVLMEDRWVAAVASAMFALDAAHGSAVGWISNRNGLIAGALSVAALLCHHRSRERRSWRWAVAAWSCFTLALLSGELAVGAAGYLFAYSLVIDRGRKPFRALTLLPYAVLLAGWAVARRLGEYGSFGIGAYVDPITEPVDFVRTLPVRIVVLLSGQITGVPSDLSALVPNAAAPRFALFALASTALCLWFVWPVLRKRASARFFAWGGLLSAVPLAATIPADRLLVLVGFGVMPVLALGVCNGLQARRGWETRVHDRAGRLRRKAALGFAALRLVLQPAVLPITVLSAALVGASTETAADSAPSDPAIAQQTLIVASVPDSVLMSYLPPMREWDGQHRPDKLYWLDATVGATVFERRNANTLRVTSAEGLFDARSEARSQRFALKRGDRVVLRDMTVEVVQRSTQGIPTVCDFVFSEPLESPRYRWQTWEGGKLQAFQVPKLGESKLVHTRWGES